MSDNNNFKPNLEGYKPLRPFNLFMKNNFPFIENTFEALDTYGLLCEIVKYLNTVIDNTNTMETNIDLLSNAFNELNDYVSHYFDNLDVQEEINNKLDEMATSGQLQELVNNYFNYLNGQFSERYDQMTNIMNTSIENQNQNINNQNTVINEQNGRIGTLESRMSQFERLEEGSTSGDAELIDIRTAWNGVEYLNAGDSVRNQAMNNYHIQHGKNIYNKNNTNNILDYYASATSGRKVSNPSYRADIFIVKPGDVYTISESYVHVCYGTTYLQLSNDLSESNAFTGFISGESGGATPLTVTIPNNAYIMIVSHTKSGNNTFQVESGSSRTTYENYVAGVKTADLIGKIPLSQIEDTTTLELTVDINGTGDYTSLKSAIDYINTQNYSKYIINILSGEYDIEDEFTSEEKAESGFIGLTIPKNVSLIGQGKTKSDVLLKYINETSSTSISTLNLTENINIENLTVYAENLRYVIHDDYSTTLSAESNGNYRNIKNCDFIGKSLAYDWCYGAGTKGNSNWKFENCRFINKTTRGCFSIHDSVNSANLNEIYQFDNCEFIGVGKYNIRLCPAKSGVEETVIFNHCTFNGILIDSQFTGDTESTTVFNILGSGNSKDYLMQYYNSHDQLSFPKFADTVKSGIANDTITRDNYIKFSNNYLINGSASDNVGKSLNAGNSGDVIYYE